MKTKTLLLALSAAVIATSLTFTSCKKKEDKVDETGQTSTDSRQAISENDLSIQDINTTIKDIPLMNGRQKPASAKTTTLSCGLSVDTLGIHTGTVKLNYDGITVCNNRKRSGSIKLTIIGYSSTHHWKDAGCVMKVDYLNYRVTRASDGEYIELNGTQMLTNISGGTWWELYTFTQPNLASSVTGTNLSVNFNGAGTATYNINRKFTYTLSSTYILSCTGEGIGSSGSLNNLENYGTTRDGDAFTSEVSTPIVWNSTCGSWAPLAGKLSIKVPSKGLLLDCLFGVNSSGTSISVGANQCAYGWKLDWIYGPNTGTKTIGYL
jgi:hypothetical protein